MLRKRPFCTRHPILLVQKNLAFCQTHDHHGLFGSQLVLQPKRKNFVVQGCSQSPAKHKLQEQKVFENFCELSLCLNPQISHIFTQFKFCDSIVVLLLSENCGARKGKRKSVGLVAKEWTGALL